MKSSKAAHPRSRGEHPDDKIPRFRMNGSSPLARGTLLEADTGDVPSRLIPARAGNTSPVSVTLFLSPAHPRSRGEHVIQSLSASKTGGSSPLARGTRDGETQVRRATRLIPARAGNTLHPVVGVLMLEAHPRSRGEHNPGSSSVGLGCGSSPLARGTPRSRPTRCYAIRLIPARAGNTHTCKSHP